MMNLKMTKSVNKKSFVQSHSYLLWCIVTLFLVLAFGFKGACDGGMQKCTITLPTKQEGIEKIEYMINGTAQGSTDGLDKIQVENGDVLSFSIQFQKEGYSKLHVRDVKIKSQNGSVLRLNTCSKDEYGNLVLMRVPDSETVDPKQTYVSSGYVVNSDDEFNIMGIAEDTYSAIIRDEDNDVNLSEAVDLKYCENGGTYKDAPFSEKDNAFIIENIQNSANVKLMINVREGYTDSDLSLVYGDNRLAISSESKICSLPEVNNDFDLSIRGLQKQKYTVTFAEYQNAQFLYRTKDETDFSTFSQNRSVYHGDTMEFKCTAKNENTLKDSEITVNDLVVYPENGIYKIENIKQNCSIAITPKNSALYPIFFQNDEKRVKLCDLSENEISSVNVNQNGSAEFKVIPSDAYSKYFITAQIYAVPASKISNGTYDITANPIEANSFLVIPNSENVYSLQNITEPMVLIATNMHASTHTVVIPDVIIGAKATVLTNDQVQQISDTKFSVNHGADFTVNLEAEPGYDISDMVIGDINNSTQVIKNGNSYTYKNIDGDKYLIINGATDAYCSVKFDSQNLVLTDTYGNEWKNNSNKIKYQSGTLQFKLSPYMGQNVDLDLKLKSGNGKLEKVSSDNNLYSLSGVTEDTVITIGSENSQNVTITLGTQDEDIQFTDIYDEKIILPEENTLKLGQDFSFKVVSKSGKSADELKITSENYNPISEIEGISNAYTVTALSSDRISTEQAVIQTKNSENSIEEPEPQVLFNTVLRGTANLLRGTSGGNTGRPNKSDYENYTYSLAPIQDAVDFYPDDYAKCKKAVGLTLSKDYTFPQSNNSKDQFIPKNISFDKEPNYIIFSTDKSAKECINRYPFDLSEPFPSYNLPGLHITRYRDVSETFSISDSRSGYNSETGERVDFNSADARGEYDKESGTRSADVNVDDNVKYSLTLPPLFFRYSNKKSGDGHEWRFDAFSPGDPYYDPSNPYHEYNSQNFKYPAGHFDVTLRKSKSSTDGKYTLNFTKFKIASERDIYATGGYKNKEYSFTLTRPSKVDYVDRGGGIQASVRHEYSASVPKVTSYPIVVYPNPFAQDSYNDCDCLFPFAPGNRFDYETPYKVFSPYNNSNHDGITIVDNSDSNRKTGTPPIVEDNEYTIHELNSEATFLYRLDECYCHVFDKLYDEVGFNKDDLNSKFGEGKSVQITTEDNENPLPIDKLSGLNTQSTDRNIRDFRVYLPENYALLRDGEIYMQPFELDNTYAEILDQTLVYDHEKKCDFIKVRVNLSTFEENLNLKWKNGIQIKKIYNPVKLCISGIIDEVSPDYYMHGKIDTSSEYAEINSDRTEYTLTTGVEDEESEESGPPVHSIAFTITLPQDTIVNPTEDNPLEITSDLDPTISSKIEQQVSEDRKSIFLTINLSAYDQGPFELNWVSPAENTVLFNTRTINMTSEGTIFKNAQMTPINSDKVELHEGLTFYTEPQEGYLLAEKLVINTHQMGTYTLDNIVNSKYIDDEEKEHNYKNEWIKLALSENSDKENTLFIRASKEGNMVKYEFSKRASINEYIEAISDEGSETTTYKLRKKTDGNINTDGIISDMELKSLRELKKSEVIFTDTTGIKYFRGDQEIDTSVPIVTSYGDTIAFKITPEFGYDISNIQVLASTNTKTSILPLTNGLYVITDITEDTTVTVDNVDKSNFTLSFNQYEGISYLNSSGDAYLIRQPVPYHDAIKFQVNVEPGYSSENMKVYAQIGNEEKEFLPKNTNENSQPYIDDNLYVIPEECVKDDINIRIEGLTKENYKVLLKTPEMSDAISYYNEYGTAPLSTEDNSEHSGIVKQVHYNESLRFQVRKKDGFDISEIEVIAKNAHGNAITLMPTNDVYTLDNIKEDYTVTVSGIKYDTHTVEMRGLPGVAYIDESGNALPSTVTVNDGSTFSFYLSFDDAYNKSKSSAKVVMKGSDNAVPHDSTGKYTVGGTDGIKENQIIEVTGVTKNTYVATFTPAEGVIYKTEKGKEFSGSLDLEHGETLKFKISLMDAYDQSRLSVKMNGTKDLMENGGTYEIPSVNEDVVITVENVEKNPEEITIETVYTVPNPVKTEEDVNTVVRATKSYESLSDDEKKLVTNKPDLERAQNEASYINHTSGDVSVSGLDWYIKLIVTPLSDNEEQMRAFEEKIERRSLLSLYKIELINLLTDEEYSIPEDTEVQVVIPCPDLTGYKNVTIAHENSAGAIRYLDPNMVQGTAKFSTATTGLFGVAAKAIPNYSEDVSDMSISTGNLTKDKEELKNLIGDELSSQLGHLIDVDDTSNDDSEETEENSDSILDNMSAQASTLPKKIYNWALDHELFAVIIILVVGFMLIAIILASNQKKGKNINKKQ